MSLRSNIIWRIFMKRFLIFGLALMLIGAALFADDAKVMPARVGRLYIAPSFVMGNKAFDSDGDRVDTHIDMKFLNLGAALEFGLAKWVTAALQWTPGINVWSKFDTPTGAKIELKGMGDLFAGAKLQIMGSEAPVQTDAFRLAFAPGVKIPLPGPDYKKQAENMAAGKSFTPNNLDHHVLGAGLRSYFDILFGKSFFLNLYNEFIYYPVKGKFEKAGLEQYVGYATANGLLASLGSSVEGEVNYGYDLTFELEPAFTFNLSPKVQFNAGLPVNYKIVPGVKYSFTGTGPGGSSSVAALEDAFPDGEKSQLLTLRPGASIFFLGWALPMEFKLSYFYPVWGKNASANQTFSFQIRAYFKI